MRRFCGNGRSWLYCAIVGMSLTAGMDTAALAGSFEFVPAPQINLNRVYRIDKATGEVSACQYGAVKETEGTVGVTLCYVTGEGAGPQPAGEYGLVATRHVNDGGIFRVNYRTGQMNVCYVFAEKVVCTPPGLAPGEAAPGAPAGKGGSATSSPR